MALLDNLTHKASVFSMISDYCLFEVKDNKLFLIPFNDIMRESFREIGIKEDEVSAELFSFLRAQNARSIWSELFSGSPYGGPRQEDYYNALTTRYWETIFSKENYNG